ncbi:MAG: hypothetical protein O7C59_08305 [Rickettsia endosymbiont of Ixodes persulcatus]|nr:hypothetical protein [Rickettsia endosymbiont of Ixodes persulcatus]
MKIMKWSSIFLLSVFFMSAFIPQVSAKKHCRSRTSFGLSFNLAPAAPNYVVAPAPAPVVVQAPAPAPVAVMPYNPYNYYNPYNAYNPYVAAPAYSYYYAPNPVIVERPAPRVYAQPGFSYSYWRY